ncbi:MAG: hybrid sensor histidine kinase/response regulator transcription factor [Wenzhouxiangellaceae bacterium]
MPDGALIVGNGNRVLIFDGARWHSVPSPNNTRVRDLMVDGDRIWAGAESDFGYYAADSDGALRFHSLIDRLPESDRDFADIWNVGRAGEVVYFNARTHLFVPSPDGDLTTYRPHRVYMGAETVNGRLLALDQGLGLVDVLADPDTPIPGGEALAEATLAQALRTRDGRWLLLTREHGLWRLDDGRPEPWLAADHPALAGTIGFDLLEWTDGRLIVATLAGLAVLSPEGTLLERIGPDQGLPSDITLSIAPDRDGGLWLAQFNHLTRIAFGLGVRIVEVDPDQSVSVSSVTRSGGRLLLATDRGLWMQSDGGRFSVLKSLPQLMTWTPEPAADGVLVPGTGGVWWLPLNEHGVPLDAARKVLEAPYAYEVRCLLPERTRCLVATDNRMPVLHLRDGSWQVGPAVEGIDVRTTRLVQTDTDTVWAGTGVQRLYRIVMDTTGIAGLRRFDDRDGLPPGNVLPFVIDGQLRIGTTEGVWRADHNADASLRFGPDPEFSGIWTQGDVFRLLQVGSGRIWLRIGNRSGLAVRDADGWRFEDRWFRALEPGPTRFFLSDGPDAVYTDSGTNLLYLRSDDPPLPPAPVPRLVSVMVDGATRWSDPAGLTAPPALELGPGRHDVRFEFALPVLTRSADTRYRTRLVGFDRDLSPASVESFRDYTNLPPGRYAFEIQATDAFGRESQARYQVLQIAAPWYATPAARIAWVVLALLLLAGAVQGGRMLRQHQLLARQRELEAQVAERTEAVRAQAAELRRQTELRERFFANVSHEFRTPLTLMLGPLREVLESESGLSSAGRELIRIARRNAREMLSLVGRLLDLNRLSADRLQLHVREFDLAEWLRHHAELCAAEAHRRGIEVKIDTPPEPVMVWGDPDQLQQVTRNILGNALKFCQSGDRIEVALTQDQGRIRIRVRDTGPGVDAADLPHLFERYYQGRLQRASQPGTGIGLALAREIVEMHGGSIEARPNPQGGLDVSFSLPLGRAHFSADQLEPGPVLEDEPDDAGDADESAFEDPAPASSPHSANRPWILVVDDHPALRRFLRTTLARNYNVQTAADGEQALQCIRQRVPDVVVCDLMMPGMDGMALLAQLRSDPELGGIGILMLSARATRRDVVAALEAGADDYMTKPFDTSELIARIEALLASRRRIRDAVREGRIRLGEGDTGERKGDASEFAQAIRAVIAAHYQDPAFDVRTLAERLHMDRSTLYRRCKTECDATPSELLLNFRLDRARELLLQHGANVAEAAYAVGFESRSWFSQKYRERFGTTPGQAACA